MLTSSPILALGNVWSRGRKMFYTSTKLAIEKRNDQDRPSGSDQFGAGDGPAPLVDQLHSCASRRRSICSTAGAGRIADVDGQVNSVARRCLSIAPVHMPSADDRSRSAVVGSAPGMPLPIKDLTAVEVEVPRRGSPDLQRTTSSLRAFRIVGRATRKHGARSTPNRNRRKVAPAPPPQRSVRCDAQPRGCFCGSDRLLLGRGAAVVRSLSSAPAWAEPPTVSYRGRSLRNPADSICGKIVGMRPSAAVSGALRLSPLYRRNLRVPGPDGAQMSRIWRCASTP